MDINNAYTINSTERSKKYRKRYYEENNITERKVKYSDLSIEEKQKFQVENLTENQLCIKYDNNKKRNKKNKRTSTLDTSYQSSLIIKWDYENPCEL